MTGSYIRRTFSPILLKKSPTKLPLSICLQSFSNFSRDVHAMTTSFPASTSSFLDMESEDPGCVVWRVTKMTARKRGQPELSASLAYSIQNEPRSTRSFRSCSIWINRFQLAVLVRFYMYSTWRKPFEVWCSMVENSWVAAVVFFGSLIRCPNY